MKDPGRTALYRLYDGHDQLLYVGVTSDPDRRWETHRAEKDWWPQVRVREIEWVGDRTEALAREASEIAQRAPRYNSHRGWQYLLTPDEASARPRSPYIPAPGTTKLVEPAPSELELLKEAVALVLEQGADGASTLRESVPAFLPPRDERIRVRRFFGLNQARFADVLGMNTLAFQRWELGHKELSGLDHLLYARALQVMAEVVEARFRRAGSSV
ncbi:GIY-YIG nuclease family protein [Streptomyces sp. MS1.AVA.3]|uniref:GIY-YIG nuclease family protein n=1 Tax=Streptomyces decoyicus TaxID=249567 RepID=UPI0030C60B0F